jgi:hypothetical protein
MITEHFPGIVGTEWYMYICSKSVDLYSHKGISVFESDTINIANAFFFQFQQPKHLRENKKEI